MRTNRPRLTPLDDSQLNPAQEALIEPFRRSGRDYNIFRTFIRHPDALKAFLGWGGYVLSERNTLPPRLREIAILRTGYRCGAGYEWSRHVPIGKSAGLTDDDIAAIKQSSDDPRWSAGERAVLDAADDLVRDQFVSEPVWTALVDALGEKHVFDVIFTVGQYTMVSMFLNSVGVQLDDDVLADADLDHRT